MLAPLAFAGGIRGEGEEGFGVEGERPMHAQRFRPSQSPGGRVPPGPPRATREEVWARSRVNPGPSVVRSSGELWARGRGSRSCTPSCWPLAASDVGGCARAWAAGPARERRLASNWPRSTCVPAEWGSGGLFPRGPNEKDPDCLTAPGLSLVPLLVASPVRRLQMERVVRRVAHDVGESVVGRHGM